MMILRNTIRDKYTVLCAEIFKDKRLNLRDRGLLCSMLSLPDNWEFSEQGLVKIFPDGLSSIKSGLKTLEECGYLERKRVRNADGTLDRAEWHVYESPRCDFPTLEKPTLENHIQSNTNISNTNNINNMSINDNGQESKDTKLLATPENFDIIWNIYPRKEGKNAAFNSYKAWIKGKEYCGKKVKLTNAQMYKAVKKYAEIIEAKQTEKQYIKMGSTFFNSSIIEYVDA